MPFNGSGVFQRVRNWVADATAGIKIRADYHDAEDDGFAAGLTNCITKDGQTIITQNIPWNSKRITGLADPINDQDAATKKYTDVKFTGPGTLAGDWTIGGALTVTGLLTANGGLTVNGTLTGNGAANFTGVVTASEFMATSGVYRFSGDASKYLYWTGGYFLLSGGKLTLGGQGTGGNDAVTWDQLATKQPNLGFTPVQQSGGAYQVGNKVYIGWDGSRLRAQVDASDLGQFVFGTSSIVSGGRLAIASDVLVVNTPAGGMYEPYGGAVVTGYQWANAGYPVITVFRYRWVQLLIGGTYYTVGISN